MYDIITLILSLAALVLFILKLAVEYSWRGMYVKIISGSGAGQIRQIKKQSGNRVTLDAAWVELPDSQSQYIIYKE